MPVAPIPMMNGDISVESEKDAGSTFTVNVALKDSDKKERYAGELRPQDMNVLIIDDDPALASIPTLL